LAGVSGTDLEFSKDGKWVAYVSEPEGSLWRSAVDGSQRLQLTSPPFGVGLPHWSPGEKQIAFCARRGGNPGRVYLVSVDGGALKRVTNGEGGKEGDIDPSWSPDGVSLAFGDYPPVTSGASIHVVDLKSSRVSVLPGSEGMWSPRWSPNGASLAFGATDHDRSGEESIHVVDLKTNHVSALPGSEGMWSPRWSPDGRFIAGLSGYALKLMLYDLGTRKQTLLSDLPSACPSWSRDGASLFFAAKPGILRIWMRDRKLERITDLGEIPAAGWGWYATAPDNSLITARDAGTDEIYALDWEAP
jgi:Tol biopolymer transport system component